MPKYHFLSLMVTRRQASIGSSSSIMYIVYIHNIILPFIYLHYYFSLYDAKFADFIFLGICNNRSEIFRDNF